MYSDTTLIQQVLLNLISNAVKFTRDGEIRLEVESATLGGQASVSFTVSDTGIGMKEEQIKLIFDEFSQASKATSCEYEGIGLGLSISKKYCTFLNGKISATSIFGKGSRFTVILPCTFDDKNAAQSAMV
jgi:signal transduction histidine kinase